MSQRHTHRLILASLPLAGLVLGTAVAAAQTPPTPPAVVTRAVVTPVPTNRVSLSVEQVRAIMIAHHRDVAAGTSEDNTVTIILASNGDYVASGSSKINVVGRGRGAAADTAKAGGAAAGQAVAVLVPRATSANNEPRMMTLAGIGEVDARLVQDMYFKSYEPGEVSMNAIRVRFVTLTGNVVK